MNENYIVVVRSPGPDGGIYMQNTDYEKAKEAAYQQFKQGKIVDILHIKDSIVVAYTYYTRPQYWNGDGTWDWTIEPVPRTQDITAED